MPFASPARTPSAAHITIRRSRAWAYRFDFARSAISSGELPRRGEYLIVTDGAGLGKCVVQVFNVKTVPFSGVTEEMCGFTAECSSPDEWRAVQEADISAETPVAFWQFRLVYKYHKEER